MVYENYKFDVIERIRGNSIPRENGCIEYAGGNLKHKYGLVGLAPAGHKSPVPAHRALWMAIHNCFDLPRTTVVRHKCDNPSCVNIDHLVAGTSKDNVHDMIARDRKAKTHALHTRKRILTDDIIKSIRSEPTGMKTKDIAKKYNISVGYVSKLRNMKAKTLITL